MSQKELKYVLISENPDGVGVIHTQAICHIAYATALESLGVANLLDSAQIRKFAAKKTLLHRDVDGATLDVHIPVKRDLNMYELMEKAQKDISQSLSDFLSIEIKHINLIVDQVVV